MTGSLSSILSKLLHGDTVILYGEIPHRLYAALTQLSLGVIEGKKFPGKLILVTPTHQQEIAKAVTGKELPVQQATHDEKTKFLNHSAEARDFADLEKSFIQTQYEQIRLPFTPYSEDENVESKSDQTERDIDERRAQAFDETRLINVTRAFSLNPWVMLEGSTGIGKSHFMKHVLPKIQATICYDIETWLKSDNAILVWDEANFKSELSGLGENFLERFKSLRDTPPHFLYNGIDYQIPPNNKVLFAYNPADYGAARNTKGFLNEHALNVSFTGLPDFYVRARLITPLLKQHITDLSLLRRVSQPLLEVYRWLIKHSNANEVLVTPRDIKAMVNLIVSRMRHDNITDPNILVRLATEVSQQVAQQALMDDTAKLKLFNTAFQTASTIPLRTIADENYPDYQVSAATLIRDCLHARINVLSPDNTDLGLGGIVLEGESNIGKTYFLEKILAEHKNDPRFINKPIYRISPSTPFDEKCAILKKAFHEGALVVAEEMNASLWPNKLLNNYLMGIDEHGNPAKVPGFFILATQNPRSYANRTEDPAVRKRLFKHKCDWPVYQKQAQPEVKADALRFFRSAVINDSTILSRPKSP